MNDNSAAGVVLLIIFWLLIKEPLKWYIIGRRKEKARAAALKARQEKQQATEYARQAKQAAAAAEKARKIEYKRQLATIKINYYAPQLEMLKTRQQELQAKINAYKSRNMFTSGAEKKLLDINKQIFKIECALLTAQFDTEAK